MSAGSQSESSGQAGQAGLLGPGRWCAMWAELGASSADEALRLQLLACYSEPARNYHSLQHLEECLVTLQPLRMLAEHAAEIELALWFHDAIYDTQRKDNEERSAHWLCEAALAAGVPEAAVLRAQAMVLATRHQALPETPDEKILIDVDLSILGAGPERFKQYEEQVQREYAWIPEVQRRASRKRILLSFLEREFIYNTEPMRQRLEGRARANLLASVAALGAPL